MPRCCTLILALVVCTACLLLRPSQARHAPAQDSYPQPEQIHIAYGDDPTTEMTIVWSVAVPGPAKVAHAPMGSANYVSVPANCTHFVGEGNPNGTQYYCRVKLSGLTPGQKYAYTVWNGANSSAQYNFTAMPAGQDWVPKLLIYGDMGRFGGSISLPRLKQEVANGWPHAIIHVGDFAYDLDTWGGVNGDQFMGRIQPMAAVIPYMTSVGNHEIPHDFSHYKNRFWMPGDTQNMWYSWDMSMVHFIAYSTEVYFTNGPILEQFQWLEADLAKANKNRDKTPWIIAFGHRPMYCSNILDGDDCTTPRSKIRSALESLFYNYGVDLIIEAHEHSYERLWPVYNEVVTQNDYINPRAPVHLISGAAGCNEADGICVNPILGPGGPWSAFRSWLPGLYGYGRLQVFNATHLQWEQVYSVTGTVEDSIVVVQNKHGPFVNLA